MATNIATLQVVIRGDSRGLERSLRDAERSVSSFGSRTATSIQRTGQLLTGVLTVPLLGVGAAATRAAMQWESAFAGVEKTLDATVEQFAQIEQGLLDLSVSSTAPVAGLQNAQTELAKIAELGGQLGVLPENIIDFTNVIGELTIATDLTGESAATMIAQFANITGMDLSAKSLQALGDSIVNVGNNMATTESNLVHFMQRIAGAASIVGFTDQEIVALAGATASVGLRAESAGTSMTKLLLGIDDAVNSLTGGVVASDDLIARRTGLANNLQAEREAILHDLTLAQERYNTALEGGGGSATSALDSLRNLQAELVDVESQIVANGDALSGLSPGQLIEFEQSGETLQKFLEIVNLAGGEFAELSATDLAGMWQGDEQEKVLMGLIQGLGELDSAAQTQALEDLGLTGIRLTDMMRRLANNSELVGDAFYYVGEAAEGALSNEAEKRFATTEAQWNRMVNTLRNLGIVIGNVILPYFNTFLGYVSDLFVRLADVDPQILKFAVGFGAVLAAIGPVLTVVGKLLVVLNNFNPVVAIVSALVAGFVGLVTTFKVLSVGNMALNFHLDNMVNSFKLLRDAVGRVLKPFKDLAVGIFRTIFPSFEGLSITAADLSLAFINAFSSISNIVNKVTSFIVTNLTPLEFIMDLFSRNLLGDFKIPSLEDLNMLVGMEDSKIFKWLFGEISAQDAAAQIISIGQTLRSSIINFVPNLENFWNTFIEQFKTDGEFDYEKLKGYIADHITTAIDSLVTSLTTYVTNISTLVTEFFNQVVAAFNNPEEDPDNEIAGFIGKTLANAYNRAIDYISNIDLSGITEPLDKILKSIQENGIIQTIISSIEDIFNIQVDPSLSTAIEGVSQAVGGFIAVTGISRLLGIKSLPDIFRALTTVFSGGGMSSVISGIRDLAGTFGRGAIVFAIIGATVGALIDRLPQLVEAFQGFIDNLSQGDWQGTLETLGMVTGALGVLFGAIGEAIADGIIIALPILGITLANLADVLGSFSDPEQNLGNTLSLTAEGVTELAAGLATIPVEILQTLINFLGALAGASEADMEGINAFIDSIQESMMNVGRSIIPQLKLFFSELISELKLQLGRLNLAFLQGLEDLVPGDQFSAQIEKAIENIDTQTAGQKLLDEIFGFFDTGTVTPDLQLFLDTGTVEIDSATGETVQFPVDAEIVPMLDSDAITRNIETLLASPEGNAIAEQLSAALGGAFAEVEVLPRSVTIPPDQTATTALLLQAELQRVITNAEAIGVDTSLLVDPSLLRPGFFVEGLESELQLAIDSVEHALTMQAHVNVNVTSVGYSGLPDGIQPTTVLDTDEHQTGGTVGYTGMHILHKGEEVLTQNEARDYRAGNGSGAQINIYGVQDVDSLLAELNRRGYALPR